MEHVFSIYLSKAFHIITILGYGYGQGADYNRKIEIDKRGLKAIEKERKFSVTILSLVLLSLFQSFSEILIVSSQFQSDSSKSGKDSEK